MKERISLITFGCKMNQAESQYISEKLSKEFDIIFEEKNGKSDAYILNTCSVTSEAERKVRQTIRRIRKSNKNAKIIAIGCYANSDPLELRSIGANLVLGNLEKKDIELYFDKEGVYSEKFFWLQNDTKILVPEESYGNRTRFFLPIEEGCINGCAFCKIRLLRGTKIISLSKKDIINKIQNLINKGYKEIVLTGTNLTCYGLDNSESFEDLLKTVENILTISESTQKVIFRPLIGSTKNETIEISKKFGLYETSILPYEDSCSVFVPQNPATKAQLRKIKQIESYLPEVSVLEDEVINESKKYEIRDGKIEEIDVFKMVKGGIL
jgi:tRNA A37 methylthiotransferase MiaB